MEQIVMSDNQEKSQDIPKRDNVFRMFDRIAKRYDLLNRLLSFRQDVKWRKKLTQLLPDKENLSVLDLATGTGDILLSIAGARGNFAEGVGLDMSGEMLKFAVSKTDTARLSDKIRYIRSDAVYLPIEAKSFDAVTISFGIRNVVDVPQALLEMYRVLSENGKVLILEFSLPENRLVRVGYLFYFRYILPFIGGIISGDSYAYSYLNKTVETFPYGEQFCKLMKQAGFSDVQEHRLTFGIATIYEATKITK